PLNWAVKCRESGQRWKRDDEFTLPVRDIFIHRARRVKGCTIDVRCDLRFAVRGGLLDDHSCVVCDGPLAPAGIGEFALNEACNPASAWVRHDNVAFEPGGTGKRVTSRYTEISTSAPPVGGDACKVTTLCSTGAVPSRAPPGLSV